MACYRQINGDLPAELEHVVDAGFTSVPKSLINEQAPKFHVTPRGFTISYPEDTKEEDEFIPAVSVNWGEESWSATPRD